jgi:hypothetical protein
MPKRANDDSSRYLVPYSPVSVTRAQIYHPLSAKSGKVSFSAHLCTSRTPWPRRGQQLMYEPVFSERTFQ